MKVAIVSVRDSAAGLFTPVQSVTALPQAVRGFADQVNGSADLVAAHPEDFELYHVADMDDQTGLVVALDPPVLVVRAKDLKRSSAS